jgi:precorrin-6B methylase 2
LRAIIEYTAARLNEDGRIVVNLAAMERAVEAQSLLVSNGMDAHTVMVNVSRGKPLPDGTTRFEALNPVFVVTATSPTGRL